MNAQPIRCPTAHRIAAAAAMFALLDLAATANSLYWGGGSADLADGTPLPVIATGLDGEWDATLKNWATDSVGTTYASWADGSFVQFGHFTNNASVGIHLKKDLVLDGLSGCLSLAPASTYNQVFNVTSAVPRTVSASGGRLYVNAVSQDSTRGLQFGPNVSLTGSAPLMKTGNARFVLAANSSAYTGTVTADLGVVELTSATTSLLTGVERFDLIGAIGNAASTGYGGNDFGNPTLRVSASSGANNKLSDTAVVHLRRGTLDYRPASGPSTETIGQVQLETWGRIGAGQGTTGGILTLGHETAGLTRGSTGYGLLAFNSVDGANTRLRLRIPNGVPTDVLLPWVTTQRSEFMFVDSANNNTLSLIPPTDANLNLANWTTLYGSGHDIRIGSSTGGVYTLTGQLGDNLTIRSLGFYTHVTSTLTIASDKTLTLASGGLAFRPATSGNNQTIAGGSLASGTDVLYLNSSDDGASQNLLISSVIVGTGMDVVKGGIGAIQFTGTQPNTYSGTTHVMSGHLTLAKSANVVAIPGDLVIRHGGSVGLNANANHQIATTAAVTVERGGLLAFSADQAFGGSLTLDGGTFLFQNNTQTLNGPGYGLAFNGGWLNHNSSSTGYLNLLTDVSYAASSSTQARFERLGTGAHQIRLNGTARTFQIADSETLAADVPEMVVDATILDGTPAGGSITKTGTGTLVFTDANSYTGGTAVNGGTLRLATIAAPAQSGLRAYTTASGSGYATIVFTEPVAANMAVGQTLTGTTIPADRRVARVLNDHEILANSYNVMGFSTNVAVSAVSRSGALGSGSVAVNDLGTLQIDPGITVTNTVAVNAGGTLASSGATMRNVTITGGTLAVDLTKGVLASDGSVSLADAAIAITGTVPESPVAVLTTTGTLTGTFATWTEGYKVTYDGNTVLVGPAPAGGMIVLVR